MIFSPVIEFILPLLAVCDSLLCPNKSLAGVSTSVGVVNKSVFF
jgi:hypothetical protein